MGLLRVVLLFGSGAIALALIVAPIAERQSRQRIATSYEPAVLDMTRTGSVKSHAGRYTLRKSVLQTSPTAVCLMRPNGERSGDC